MALVSTMNPLAAQPFQHHVHHQPATNGPSVSSTNGHHLAPVKDSRWLTLELCREFQRGKCSRSDTECKYAHPPPHVEVQNGRVVCCYDSIKGKCQRKEPPCKYLHPPQHLKEQLLQNGRNNLLMKNLQLQMAGLSMPVLQPSIVPMPLAAYPSYEGGKASYQASAGGYTSAALVQAPVSVVTHPYLVPNSLTINPYMTSMALSANGLTVDGTGAVTSTAAISMPTTSASLIKTTRTESAPPTISSSSMTNGVSGDPWNSAPNPYSPIYYQGGMVPMMKRPMVSSEVKNGLHVYQTAPPVPYPQPMPTTVHLSQMQPTYVPVAAVPGMVQQQQQSAHY